MEREAQLKLVKCLAILLVVGLTILVASDLLAQSPRAVVRSSHNRPLSSLRAAGQAAVERGGSGPRGNREILNYRGTVPSLDSSLEGPDPVLQTSAAVASTSMLASFAGSDNNDNAAVLGFRVAPPDTDGDVGPSHFVQMINLVTTIFDKSGGILAGPFPSNSIWSGMGGNCEPYNQGDPIVVYDETNNRWVVSQFAFDNAFTTFSQCVAASQSGDPAGAYNRYEFSFDGLGLPDYPKHGISTDSVTMIANLFSPPTFFFSGTFIGAIDKAAMYAGSGTLMVGFNLGTNEFGFLAGDLDDPGNTAGFVPALYGTVKSVRQGRSTRGRFDIWQVDPDFGGGGAGASAGRIASIPVSAFDTDLCGASREACIPQLGGPSLEAISDRLMQRLQIRDFGGYRTMVSSHTVDVGGGRAGIRWYELRQVGGSWGLHQEGTFAPADGLHRWMPSIAMNAAGDIGLGYLVSSSSSFVSIGVAGQSSFNSGSGQLDSAEVICQPGSNAQTNTARAGDYSATVVDPVDDTFWHTNEYFNTNPVGTQSFHWDTRVCQFQIDSTPPPPATDIHVASLQVGAQGISKGQKRAVATVVIEDDNGNRVAGALVSGTFGGPISESVSGTTDANGEVTLFSSGTFKKGSVTFCVSNVVGALPYDPADNTGAYACTP